MVPSAWLPHCVLLKDGVPKRDPESQQSVDVQCKCQYRWCFMHREAHNQSVARCWRMERENQDEADMTWILANTKPCPKCGNQSRRIKDVCTWAVVAVISLLAVPCWRLQLSAHARRSSCNKFLEKPDQEQEASRQNLARYAHFELSLTQPCPTGCYGNHITKFREIWKSCIGISAPGRKSLFGGRDSANYQLSPDVEVDVCLWLLCAFSKEQEDYFVYQQGMLEQKVDQLQALAEEQDLDRYHDDAEGTQPPSEEQSE